MNGAFYDQLGNVAGVFEQWGACEKTVVACALAKRVPWPGLKILQRAIDAAVSEHTGEETLEKDANDEVLLANLLAPWSNDDESEGIERLRKLISLLPLMKTDNERAKDLYVNATPVLVQTCIDAPHTTTLAGELCRQLLTYMLVHPALTHQDQRQLAQWLRYLEGHLSSQPDGLWQKPPTLMPNTNIWSTSNPNGFRKTIGKNVEFRCLDPAEYTTDLLHESFSKNGRDVDISLDGEKCNFDATIAQPKSQRSNSLTPPTSNVMSSSSENLSDEPFVQKPRSFSLSSEHSLSQLRPLIYGTTGSETRLDDLKSSNFTEYPGMSMVAAWLKSLRLHKYVWLFSNISYEQMMALDEEYLEKLGVTKGARHKLLLSIRKLSERPAALQHMCSELGAGAGAVGAAAGAAGAGAVGAAPRVLQRLRGVLISPMGPGSEVPEGVVRVLELASRLVSPLSGAPPRPPPPEEEPEMAVDPMSLHCWLVEKALHHESFAAPSLQAALRRLRHRLPPRQFFRHVSGLPPCRAHQPRWRTGHFGYKQLPRRPWGHAPAKWAPPPPRGKSHSYPPFPPPAPPAPPLAAHDYSSLDALCLQMTEQAIN